MRFREASISGGETPEPPPPFFSRNPQWGGGKLPLSPRRFSLSLCPGLGGPLVKTDDNPLFSFFFQLSLFQNSADAVFLFQKFLFFSFFFFRSDFLNRSCIKLYPPFPPRSSFLWSHYPPPCLFFPPPHPLFPFFLKRPFDGSTFLYRFFY